MKAQFFSVVAGVAIVAAGWISSTASAQSASRCVRGSYGLICEYDVVRYRHNEAIGTVVRVDSYRRTVDVDWNIVGHGYGRDLSPNDLIPRGGSAPQPPPPDCIRVVNARIACEGDVVRYRYNQAIGTIVRVYPRRNAADVDWNIVGSGFGRALPGQDLIRR